MNKRIKELAEQAQQYAEYVTPQGCEWFGTFKEKFAELLVRECAKAADEGMAQVTMRVEWPSYHIKKHFGVEE
jgi:hypothetical protein